jgi:hypothetical protein
VSARVRIIAYDNWVQVEGRKVMEIIHNYETSTEAKAWLGYKIPGKHHL